MAKVKVKVSFPFLFPSMPGVQERMVVRFETERMLVWEMFVACRTYVLWSRSDFLLRAHSILVMSVGRAQHVLLCA